MSDGDYAEMIEIPVSTCEMVLLPKKRSKRNLRKRVIDRVNKNLESQENEKKQTVVQEVFEEKIQAKQFKPKRKFTFDIITAQVAAIFVLVVAILVTNIFWEDSGINNLLKSVFKTETPIQTDVRNYTDFNAVSPTKTTEIDINGGIMTISSEGAIYSPCIGVIEEINENDGKFTITISHSDTFKTIIRNADYAYFDIGETVYSAVPVCYSAEGGAQVLMYDNNALLTGYTVVNGSILWQN